MASPDLEGVPMYDTLMAVKAAAQGWGRILIVPVANPTPPLDWSVSVPGGRVWQPLAVHATFATDANVSNRQVALIADNGAGGQTAWQATKPGAVVATTTILVDWHLFAGYGFTTPPVNAQAVHLPHFPLQPGWRLRSTTANAQAADAWTAITVTVFEVDVQLYAQAEATALDSVIGSTPDPYNPAPYHGLFT